MIKNRLTAMIFVLGLSMHQVDAAASEGSTVILSRFVRPDLVAEIFRLKDFIKQLKIEKDTLEAQRDKQIPAYLVRKEYYEEHIASLDSLITKELDCFDLLIAHYRFYYNQAVEGLEQKNEALRQENEAIRQENEAIRKKNEALDQEEQRLQSQMEKLMKLEQHKCD